MNDPELTEAFLAEAAEHLATVEDDILALEKGEAGEETVHHLFRALHTVKGSSSFLDVPRVTALAHDLENVVGKIRTGALHADERVTEALLEGVDKLKALLGNLEDESIDIEAEMAALRHFTGSSGARERGGKKPEGKSKTPTGRRARALAGAAEDPAVGVGVGLDAAAVSSPPPPQLDAQQAVSLRPGAPPSRTPSRLPGSADAGGGSAVRISLSLLDKLMNLATELVLVRNQNMQAVAIGDRKQLLAIAQRLNVVTSDLQASIMQTRMRPVGAVLGKFNRYVRDLAKKLGKEVELEVYGSDVELDKNIIEAINDPLTHLVRNAVDHGTEPPGVREREGKPRRGRVTLSAYHQGGQVNIRIEDDGKGMDPEALKREALLKDLINLEQAESMPDRDAFNLIFAPGFSLADEVTDVSGRGVGMDVVKAAFKKLGGVVDVSSTAGRGTTITIKLPLTLAIVPTLIVAIERSCFAIPQVNIDEIVWLYGDEVFQSLMRVDDQEVYWLRGKLLPILRLSKVLGVTRTYTEAESGHSLPDRRADAPDRRGAAAGEAEERPEAPREPEPVGGQPLPEADDERREGRVDRRISIENSVNIVVLKLGEERFGLLVDRIIDTEEIVVKPLHDQLKSCGAFAGTTVLGDGRIAMILDVGALVELGRLRLGKLEPAVTRITSSQRARQTVLLFNIGGPETFAVPLSLITRVEEVPVERIHRANDREYFEYRGNISPLIRLENADGSLTARYGEQLLYVIVPKCRRPVGVLAATILDTFEASAEIDSDTISREGYYGSALIEGRLTLFIDLFTMIERLEPDWLAEGKGSAAPRRRVLLVEDSALFASLITPQLKNSGFQVVYARNGEEGLEHLSRQRFDFVVSDLEMPVMDGFELARRVRGNEAYRALPLLAISSLRDESIETEARRAGFDRFESKLDHENLLRAIVGFADECGGSGGTPR